MNIRTTSIRTALNDLRKLCREGSLPAHIALDDGTNLTVTPFVCSEKNVYWNVGDVIPGVWTVTRRSAESVWMSENYVQ